MMGRRWWDSSLLIHKLAAIRITCRGLVCLNSAAMVLLRIILSSGTPEKAMAPHPSTLAWKIPWTEDGGLKSMGLLRAGHDWATSLSLFTFMHWRRQWQPTPVFLPGESQGQGGLVGCRLWGRTVRHDWSDLAAAAAAAVGPHQLKFL